MNTWKIVLATVVIFAAGVVTGGLLTGRVARISARQVKRAANALELWPHAPETFFGPRSQALKRNSSGSGSSSSSPFIAN